MNKNTIIAISIVVLVIAVGFILVFVNQDRISKERGFSSGIEEAVSISENWIVNNSPTYLFDGSDLTLLSAEEIGEERYSVEFSFISSSAGFGDRTGMILAQVITPHEIEIVVENGEVVSALVDGFYDEMRGMREVTHPETIFISFYLVAVSDGIEQFIETTRNIPYTTGVARASIEALLEGPTESELDSGLTTSIPEGTELISIEIENDTAKVNFTSHLQEGVAGSARVTSIREQIERTLLQFNEIEDVLIMVEGESEDILQP